MKLPLALVTLAKLSVTFMDCRVQSPYAMSHVWKPDNSFRKSLLFPQCETQGLNSVVKLGSKHHCPLSLCGPGTSWPPNGVSKGGKSGATLDPS